MKKIIENLYVILFIIIIFGILIISIITPDKTFSDYENRALQKFPKLNFETFFDGKFQDQFEDYTSDQLILKNQLVKIKNYLDIFQLKKEVNGVYLNDKDTYIERHSKKDYDLELLKNNIDNLNNFKDKYNAEIYLIPNASSIITENLKTKEDFDFNENLKEIENIEYVDNILNNYKGNKKDLYYKTDHHWTTIGAYELYKNIVEKPVELNLEIVDESFFGTINNKLNINMNPDTIYKQKSNTKFEVYYDLSKEPSNLYSEKYLKTKDKYSYFLDSNHGLVQIKNKDIKNNEKILIIKDSYANCLVPFIAENYKDTEVIDLRYFNMPISQYIKMNNFDRILVIYNKDGFTNNTNIIKLKF